MATVGLTDAVRGEIKGGISALFKERLDAATRDMTRAVKRKVYEIRVGKETAELVDKLPKGWVPEESYITVQVAAQGTETLSITIPGPWRRPQAHSLDQPPLIAKSFIRLDDPEWADEADKIATFVRVSAELGSALKAADGAIASCKSLNQLVKIWPAVESYLSDATKEKLARKPAKSEGPDLAAFEASLSPEARATLLKANLLKT